jgi:hypothetical protein
MLLLKFGPSCFTLSEGMGGKQIETEKIYLLAFCVRELCWGAVVPVIVPVLCRGSSFKLSAGRPRLCWVVPVFVDVSAGCCIVLGSSSGSWCLLFPSHSLGVAPDIAVVRHRTMSTPHIHPASGRSQQYWVVVWLF